MADCFLFCSEHVVFTIGTVKKQICYRVTCQENTITVNREREHRRARTKSMLEVRSKERCEQKSEAMYNSRGNIF